MWFLSVIGLHVKPSGCANILSIRLSRASIDSKQILHTMCVSADAPPVENFWLRHCPKLLLLMVGIQAPPDLTCSSWDPPLKSISQTASRSVHPFLKGSRLWPTERQTDRQTDAQTDREANRQADRQTSSQTHRQTDRDRPHYNSSNRLHLCDQQKNRQTERQMHRQTDRQTDRDRPHYNSSNRLHLCDQQTVRQTDRQTERQTGRQTDRHPVRRTDRQRDIDHSTTVAIGRIFALRTRVWPDNPGAL